MYAAVLRHVVKIELREVLGTQFIRLSPLNDFDLGGIETWLGAVPRTT